MHKQNMSSLYFDILAQELAAIRVVRLCTNTMGNVSPMMRKIKYTLVEWHFENSHTHFWNA